MTGITTLSLRRTGARLRMAVSSFCFPYRYGKTSDGPRPLAAQVMSMAEKGYFGRCQRFR